MATFRKKPVLVEAEQFLGFEDPGDLGWPVGAKTFCVPPTSHACGMGRPHVHTIHGNQVVLLEEGDWILPEPDGEHFYPVKPDIFEATYERVSDR